MNFIQNILEEKGGDLLGALTDKAGFVSTQAEAFIPEAGRSVAEAMTSRAGSLDLSDLASEANVGSIIGDIDIAGLASRAGVTAEQGARGLGAIVPMILGFLGEKTDGDGLLSMLGGLGGMDGIGDAVDKLKGLGGLFGR